MAYSGGASIMGGAQAITRPPKPKAPPKPKTTPVPFTAGSGKPPAKPAPAKSAAPTRPNRPAPKSTDPLAPLTPQQVRQQATKTVSKAYAPNNVDLNQQQQTAQNLYGTQTADDNAFQTWLSGQSSALNAQISGVNQKLTDVLSGIRSSEQSQFTSAVPNAATAVAGQPGSSTPASQLQGGEALGGLNPVVASEGAMSAQAGANQAETGIAGNLHMLNASEVGNARIQQVRGAQLDQLNKTLNGIAGERTKLIASRAGDIEKEIARLNGIEISKAQFRVNNANLQSEIGIKRQSANAATSNALTNSARAVETARHNAALERIDTNKNLTAQQKAAASLAETERHNKVTEGIQQQNATTSASKAAGGAAGKPPKLTNTQRLAVSGYINTLRNAIIDDINKYHRGQPNALSLAYHDIASGRYSKATGNSVGASPPLGADKISYLNAATNTLTDYGASGLSPGDVAFLQSIGYGTAGYPVKMQNKGTNPRQDASGNTIGQ